MRMGYRNAQSHDTTINLIHEVRQRGYNVTQVRSFIYADATLAHSAPRQIGRAHV